MSDARIPYASETLPLHWCVQQAKTLYNIQLGKMLQTRTEGSDDTEIEYLKAAHVQWQAVSVQDLPTMWASPRDIQQYAVANGDLLVCEGGEVGRAAIVDTLTRPTIIQNALHRVRPCQGDTRFFMYFLHHVADVGWFEVVCNRATIAHLTGEKLRALLVPTPPLLEQRVIADFLDRKTKAIDDLIQKKEQLIELLQEKRQALITRAVTKGLDPTMPMKDSGIEWLGEIPAHWEVLQLGKAIKLQRGFDITKNEQQSGPFPVVSSGGIFSHHTHAMARGPGVIIGRKGTLGTVHYVDVDYWPHDTTLWVIQFRGNLPRFVYYKLLSMNLERLDTGSANPTLNRNLVHPIRVAWPPVHEQSCIVEALDTLSEQTERVSERIFTQIERLSEYRQALISAAVTGKIDVTKETAC